MPPSLPTSASVAVATARILEAYLSNHKLSPTEAASLGGRIADALGDLTSSAGVKRHTVPAAEPTPKRRATSRITGRASLMLAPMARPEPEPEPEPEPADMAADGEAEALPVPAAEPIQERQPEAEAAQKRKRPSRPRSRRGQGAGAAVDSAVPSGAEPEDEARPDDEPRGEAADSTVIAATSEAGVAPEPVAPEAPGEDSAVPAKPRRVTNRSRRVMAP